MPNFYPPEVTIPVYAVFGGVAVALTILRFWARISFTKQRLGPDDWLIAFGVTILMACCGIQFWNALKGMGGNAVNDKDSLDRVAVSKKVDFVMVLIEKPAFGAIKLSLLFFYRRIFSVWKSFNVVNTVFIVIVAVWTLGFVITDLSMCGLNLHYEFLADQSLAKAHCGDKGLSLLVFAVTSLVTDLLVLSIPFFYIRRLQMPREKKWATYMIFFLGFVATTSSVLRTIFLGISYPTGRMSWGYKAPEGQKNPLVLDIFNPTFWVMVEMSLGAWAANFPAISPLLGAIGFREFASKTYRAFSSITSLGTSQKSRRKSSSAYRSAEKDREIITFGQGGRGPTAMPGATLDTSTGSETSLVGPYRGTSHV